MGIRCTQTEFTFVDAKSAACSIALIHDRTDRLRSRFDGPESIEKERQISTGRYPQDRHRHDEHDDNCQCDQNFSHTSPLLTADYADIADKKKQRLVSLS